jgi:uncharacterized membrane protein
VSGRRRAAIALAVAASAACALVAHAILSQGGASTPGALVALVPLTFLGITFARRLRHPTVMLLVLLPGIALAWAAWGLLRHHFADLFFVEHAGMMGLLAFIFGRTLLPGTEPLVSRFARAVHGELDEPSVRYTRSVTIAWTVFFSVIFAGSCALYLTGHVPEWSLLANIVTPLAVVLMFVVEYGVRKRALPHQERASILAGVRAFRRHLDSVQARH